MIQIKKRDGILVPFNKQKIINAINKAMIEVDGQLYEDDTSNEIAQEIEDAMYKLDEEKATAVSVEDIQDMVEDELMQSERRDVAKAYILYRDERTRCRGNTTDNTINEIVKGKSNYWNKENSNKNPVIVTTQRDYIAGASSTDLARRKIFPRDIIAAHDDGIIHIHDMDYMAQNALTNCFRGDEKFITKEGVRSFCSYKDGEEVIVPTHTGEWKKAIVRKYGIQKINKVTLKRGSWTKKEVYVTPNHRWLLKNGQVTTNLKIGDYLLKTPILNEFDWEELSQEEKIIWAKGFAYGDGHAIKFANSWYTDIHLCGKKNQYVPLFEEAGLKVTYPPKYHGDASVKIPNYNKNEIPENMTLEEKKVFIYGFLCADGTRTTLKNHGNSYNEFKMVQVTGSQKVNKIYDLLNTCGYYVSKIDDLTGQITNYGQRTDVTKAFYFQANQTYSNWRVIDIQPAGECEVWCLEVEDNHSFILEKGVVTGNCELVNLEDMLQNGTVINEVLIEKPHRILTASTIATQIILAVTSSTYGGCTITLTHLAPFVRDSFILYLKESFKWIARPDNFLEEKINSGEWLGYNFIKENYPESFAYAMDKTKKEIEDATQTFNYQVNSMTNTNGQAPFLSVFMYLNETDEYKDELSWLIEEFLKQRILGFKNKQGVYITPAFPKLLYVLEKDNINPKGKYYYLTKLAAECTAKRMVPDYISEKKMFELKGDCYPCMGCRSFLTPDPINHKYYGRFNAGVVSISLPDIALSSHKNYDKFWKIFDERLELCHKALQIRHHRIANITSDAAPILWQYGAFARLKAGESVKPLLYNNYSTLSLGYGGLYECVKYMTGYSHMEPEGKQFALDVMKHLNDKCNEWKLKENIAYSLYGTPMESLTYKIATHLKRKFPEEWKEMGDKNYITNSYHYPVAAEVDAFTKLADESEFQELSPGGAISYVEVPNMSNNIPAVLEILSFIYDNIMYAELNCKFDYCQKCGYNGEMQIDENMNWYCPSCGNTDQTSMNIARRTCGYIGTNKWNYGRTQEIKERVLHLDN